MEKGDAHPQRSPNNRFGPRLADLLLRDSLRIARERGASEVLIRLDYNRLPGERGPASRGRVRTRLRTKPHAPEGGARFALSAEGRDLLEKCADAIREETGASGVRLLCRFVFHAGQERSHGNGTLHMSSFITPDGTTERLLDPNVPMPRGSSLQHEACERLRRQLKALRRGGGEAAT